MDRRSLLLFLAACSALPVAQTLLKDLGVGFDDSEDAPAPLPVPGPGQAVATFAGGCFWCMEAPFDILPGVLATTSGYTDGFVDHPTYGGVSSGLTGHAESVQVLYDPAKTSYAELLDAYWRAIDPTQADGQFVDHGRQYRTAVFTHNEEQAAEALASRERLAASGVFGGRPIVTEIKPASTFWPAEAYHQDYYTRSNRYKVYRFASGRDAFIASVWGEQYVANETNLAAVKAEEIRMARERAEK